MMKTLRGLLTVPAIALSLAVAAPAAGAATTARIAPPASLNDDGTVTVPVEYTCDAGRQAQFTVELEQRKAQDYTSGQGSMWGLDCTGTRQVVDVIVHQWWGPFDNGRAMAWFSFYSYDANGYDEVRDAGMIRIAN